MLTVVFTAVQLIPKPGRPAYAQSPAPPLPVPEDPLGQQPEQETPETYINVDVRDLHLVVRVVDVWGPGRVPLVYRSLTNTQPSSLSGPGQWHLNHFMAGVGREPDGTLWTYKFTSTRPGPGQYQFWETYVKDIGTYQTMEQLVYCPPPPPPDPQGGQRPQRARPAPSTFTQRTRGVMVQTASAGCTLVDGYQYVYLPKGVVRTYRNGLIQQVRDANNNITTFTWTTFSDQIQPYIQSVTDPVGRTITYAYDRTYRECLAYNDMGICIQWSGYYYRVRSLTDAYGRTVTYTYDGAGQLASVTNAAGRTTTYTYYTSGLWSGLISGITNPRGYTTTFSYMIGPRVTAPDGTYTSYSSQCCGGTGGLAWATATNARGYGTTYNMYIGEDPLYAGNIERITDPLGNVTTFTYDARHNVTQVTDARGNRTTYTYNSRNKITQVVKAAGSLNLTTNYTWDGNDNLLSVTNPRGIRTDYTYNAQNNLTSVRKAVGTADESLTQYTYNSWGGVASVIDPRNNTTTYAYTARHQIQTITPPIGGTTTFTYNTLDDQITKTDGNSHTWTTAYNASRLVTSVTDPLNNIVQHTYDNNNNHATTTDSKNQVTSFTYDNRDRLTRITDPLNGQTQYAYDAVSNLTQITNARNYATTLTYDADNRVTQARDALTQTTSYQYDAVGNRTQMTDRKSQVQTYTYDQANRLTQVSGGGQTINYTYDANSNRLTLVDLTGTTSYLYDNLDRLTRTTYPDTRTVQMAYDRASNRTNLTNPGGTATSYAYDAANRLNQMTQGSLTWTFGYDAAGNRTSLNHPNGTTIAYTFLNNNWLSSISHRAPSGSTFQSFTYTYDANGNRLTQADPSGTTTFTYDTLNRLAQAAYPGGYGTYSWTMDAVGNRLSQTAPGGTTNYTYDANNRLTQAGSATYGYDANGNLTSISTGRTFTWDVFNRMTSTTASGSTVTYTYNGDGLKTRRVGPNGTTNYYHDGFRHIWETDSSGAMTAQYDRDIFGNLLSRLEPGSVRRYYHHEGTGSTTALTDASGTVSGSILYDAWGNQRTITGSGQGNYRFAGTEVDTSTGLYHMGARFYDPTIGRWLSEDVAQDQYFDPTTLNFYTYANSNPLLLTDITGRGTDDAPLYLPSADQERYEQFRSWIGSAWSSIVQILQKYEGLFGWSSMTLAFAGAMLAIAAIGGNKALAGFATAAAWGSLLATAATLVSQVVSGSLSWGQALFIGAMSMLGLWGAAGGKVASAVFANTLTTEQAGWILAWMGARNASMISSPTQELILQHNRSRR
jgi:RHS repeat-associated protein